MGVIERLLKITGARITSGPSDEELLLVTVDTGEWFEINILTDTGKAQLTELLGAVNMERIINAYELIGKSFGRRALSFHHFKAITKTERQQDSKAVELRREAHREEERDEEVRADNQLDADLYALEDLAVTEYDKAVARVLRQLYERK